MQPETTQPQYAIETRDLSIFYGPFEAVKDVNLKIEKQKITAIIGPSGCGKSTLLRAFNRMNDFVPTSRVEGEILMHGTNLYSRQIDPVEVRRRIGMVFQKPNPFPKSIYDNIAWGARINGFKGNMDELVEQSLRGAALWEEVKDKLKESAYALSGGQQIEQSPGWSAARWPSSCAAQCSLISCGGRPGSASSSSSTAHIPWDAAITRRSW